MLRCDYCDGREGIRACACCPGKQSGGGEGCARRGGAAAKREAEEIRKRAEIEANQMVSEAPVMTQARQKAREVLARADEILSFGPITLPHNLARVVLLEQLYRSWSLLHNHPYHRA